MSIRSLKQHADELASDARELKSERNQSAARCLAILRDRVSSPAGLAICFGAGVLTGSRSRHHRDDADKHKTERNDGESLAVKALSGPLGATAIKLASAFIAGAVMKPEATEFDNA